ncbi:FliM/FliN family flagellar motor C-terminal domain-containing protein [Ruegeria arenilitoris]|uniref:FliM/FliN family flagellar motor C-terminal domain-containing protein n=1 Tax=Ruegeria arenilitoris TaxID=1173585 RepID=UPI00147DE276|nr:FliM/FliN family flagellar motor C-terminal domain-containing protein [Ruegeria arenilitoris]
MTQTISAALARKLSVGQEEQGDKPRSVLRALRLAFARAAGDRLQLPMVVIGAKQSHRTPDMLADQVGEDWLLLQFVDGDGALAAICMDIGAVSAIVQVQTIGEVMAGESSPRAFTPTDGAMVVPLIEDAMARAVDLVEAPGDQSSLSGFEFATRLADLRTLSLAMVEDAYRVFDLTVELGGGLRQGQISVFLPDRTAEDADELTQEDTGPNLEQASGVLRAELNTVICRMSLPLASLSRLKTGDVLPLTGSRLDRAEVLTIDRSRAAIGRLGQCGGMRAVRLNEYTPLTALTQSETAEFLEARTIAAPQPDPDMPAPTELSQMPVAFDPGATSETEPNLNFADSDQMVAEISQLAGLKFSDTDPGALS